MNFGSHPLYAGKPRRIAISDINYKGTPYQREASSVALKDKLKKGFEPRIFHPVDLSEQEDGTLNVIDGVQRIALALSLEHPAVLAFVHTDLTPDEEARLFEMLNKGRKTLTPYDLHKSALVRGTERNLTLEKVAKAAKYVVVANAPRNTTNRLPADTGLFCVDLDGTGDLLKRSLTILNDAYPNEVRVSSPHGNMIKGLCLLITKLNGGEERAHLINRLRLVPLNEWKNRAAGFGAAEGGGARLSWVAAMVEAYDKGLRGQSKRLKNRFELGELPERTVF